jgi:hypothetical protein
MKEANDIIENFKRGIEKQRRNLAKKYHPDKKGGNENHFKTINNICDELLKIQLVQQRPRVSKVTIIRTSSIQYTSTDSGKTYSTTYWSS